MLGGLYGDLPPPSAKDEETTTSSVWSSSTAKMAPSALRKPSTMFSPLSVTRNNNNTNKPKAPSNSNSNSRAHSYTSGGGGEGSISPAETAFASAPALVAVTSTVIEEYDPARPNDYEEYRRERRRRQLEEEMRREMERRRHDEEQRERERERERESSEEMNMNMSGEEAWLRRAAMSQTRSPSPPPEGKSAQMQMTAAQRMMAKMGWKEGQGLGKQEQGITTPLMAKKTDKRAGVIVNASDHSSKKIKSANITTPPTKVLLLRNMVGPGEVDDELEEEVASECAKYGTVTRVLIFEITEPDFPADEAVRIFVQFERAEQTTKALIDLDGRFFGGRVVHASFYDEDRFSKNELAPAPGEIPGYP